MKKDDESAFAAEAQKSNEVRLHLNIPNRPSFRCFTLEFGTSDTEAEEVSVFPGPPVVSPGQRVSTHSPTPYVYGSQAIESCHVICQPCSQNRARSEF